MLQASSGARCSMDVDGNIVRDVVDWNGDGSGLWTQDWIFFHVPSTLDLGIDWGDVDLVVNVGAPKGSSRLMQRIGRANHRLDEPSRAVLIPANRFEVLECRVAIDAIASVGGWRLIVCGEIHDVRYRERSLARCAAHPGRSPAVRDP